MNTRIAVALLLVCAPLAKADVVELSPDLYLVIRVSRIEDSVAIKVGAITEANKFAASTGRVPAPVTGRLTFLGPMQKQYEYQFRVMNHAEALAAKPTLADAVISIDGGGACTPAASHAVAAMVPGMFSLAALRDRGDLVTNEAEAEAEAKAAEEADKAAPVTAPEDAPQVTAQVSAQ